MVRCAAQTYAQAQGQFSILVDPQGDGRVRVSLTPELEYGESRQQWVGQDGVLRLQSGKPKQTFDKLRLDFALAHNETLVLSSLSERPGSLGHYLFTEPRAGQMDQKLLLIRLASTKYDDLFTQAIRAAKQRGRPHRRRDILTPRRRAQKKRPTPSRSSRSTCTCNSGIRPKLARACPLATRGFDYRISICARWA